ncbi:MAG: type II toxin-antitoxin system RelE/ParE family toxin [Acidithiobacillus ferrivorans]
MSFADKQTAAVFAGLKVRRFGAELLRMAQRKLAQLHRAGRIEDLAVPPGNRLEKLSGDRNGQWSMRINDQWRDLLRMARQQRLGRGDRGLSLMDGGIS